MRAIAQRIVELTGSSSGIVFEPLPMDNPCHRQPDITFAKSTLGWEPVTKLDDGLKRTAEYFRRQTKEATDRAKLRHPV